ncbi:MAG: hypothetical protein GF387_03440 [Candidatus Portnoybacteria bacterium]|nr:hypothetical protein [Candidatus Portnoybacteria bacterium]
MKKSDIIASLILGLIVGIFSIFILKSLGVTIIPLWSLLIILPVLALIGIYIAYLIGKKLIIIFQFAKFAAVGFANTAVDFGILNLLMWATSTYEGSKILLLNSISFLIAVIHSYAWNKFWTFRAGKRGDMTSQFLQFLVVTIIGLLINGSIVYLITTYTAPMFGLSMQLWANIAKVVATVFSLIWNFVGYKFIVFKKKEIKNEPSSNIQKI